eukprot:s1532_g5.t1
MPCAVWLYVGGQYVLALGMMESDNEQVVGLFTYAKQHFQHVARKRPTQGWLAEAFDINVKGSIRKALTAAEITAGFRLFSEAGVHSVGLGSNKQTCDIVSGGWHGAKDRAGHLAMAISLAVRRQIQVGAGMFRLRELVLKAPCFSEEGPLRSDPSSFLTPEPRKSSTAGSVKAEPEPNWERSPSLQPEPEPMKGSGRLIRRAKRRKAKHRPLKLRRRVRQFLIWCFVELGDESDDPRLSLGCQRPRPRPRPEVKKMPRRPKEEQDESCHEKVRIKREEEESVEKKVLVKRMPRKPVKEEKASPSPMRKTAPLQRRPVQVKRMPRKPAPTEEEMQEALEKDAAASLKAVEDADELAYDLAMKDKQRAANSLQQTMEMLKQAKLQAKQALEAEGEADPPTGEAFCLTVEVWAAQLRGGLKECGGLAKQGFTGEVLCSPDISAEGGTEERQ